MSPLVQKASLCQRREPIASNASHKSWHLQQIENSNVSLRRFDVFVRATLNCVAQTHGPRQTS